MATIVRWAKARVGGLAIAALAAVAAEPVAAQQAPFLSPLEAARHAAKMTACIELWNLYIAAEQTNEDAGGNLDLSNHIIEMRTDRQDPGSKSITINPTVGQLTGVCGLLSVAGPGKGPADFEESIMAASTADVVKAADQYFNITEVGGQVGEETLTPLQKATDSYSAEVMQKLSGALSGSGEKLSDLRIIAHQPILPIGSSDKFIAFAAQRTDLALRTLYPSQ